MRAGANALRGALALASLASFSMPVWREPSEYPLHQWRRGLLPRRWRSTRCGCATCRASRPRWRR